MPRIIVTSADVEDMAHRLARRIQQFSRQAQDRPFTIALAGGNTPKRLYEVLSEGPYREEIQWGGLEFFFGDERSVPPEHPDSNYGMAHRALFSKVQAVVHRMPAELGDADAYEAVLRERVAADSQEVPKLDLVLLGIGKDGHTASLFPGTAGLQESSRLVVMNDVPQLNTRRMTFTYRLINAAQRVWILAAGADKREIVRRCLSAGLEPEHRAQWPVLGVRPSNGELVWWLDQAAAGTQ